MNTFINLENKNIERYHYEEIILILFILQSDISKYGEEELSTFSESIEGRLEVLLEKDFLHLFDSSYGFNEEIICKLEKLKSQVISLYSPRWLTDLTFNPKILNEIRILVSSILKDLKIYIVDPLDYIENHLDENW